MRRLWCGYLSAGFCVLCAASPGCTCICATQPLQDCHRQGAIYSVAMPLAAHLASLASSVHSWLLRLRFGAVPAPALLPAPAPVLPMSAPVRRDAVADPRPSLTRRPIRKFLFRHSLMPILSSNTQTRHSPIRIWLLNYLHLHDIYTMLL